MGVENTTSSPCEQNDISTNVFNIKNADIRGILRGGCSSCDCAAYDAAEDGRCKYCQHVGPAHQRIDNHPASSHSVPGGYEVKFADHFDIEALHYYGEPASAFPFIGLAFVITFLVMFTVGLVTVIILPILLVLVWFSNRLMPTNKLRFDHTARVMLSDGYDPIPYDQITLTPFTRAAAGCNSRADCRIEIYVDGVVPIPPEKWRRPFLWIFVQQRPLNAPLFTFGTPNMNVYVLRGQFQTLVRASGIKSTEMNITWDAAQVCMCRYIQA